MANRYMSNLRSNASSGYYDTISAIVAADSQARSAAIQSQYGAMSNSITVIADSMIKGMNSAAQYQLEQEKLITARRVAESEMAAKATEMQIREQEAESQRLYRQAQYDQIARANKREDLQQKAAPHIFAIMTGLPGAIAKAQAESDPEVALDTMKDEISLVEGKIKEAEAVTPGIYGAVMNNEGVMGMLSEVNKTRATRLSAVAAVDSVTGQQYRGGDLKDIFAPGSNSSNEQRIIALRAIEGSNSSPGFKKTRENALAWKTAALSDEGKKKDPLLYAALTVSDAKSNPLTRVLADGYEKRIAAGEPPATAFTDFSRQLSETKSMLREETPPPPSVTGQQALASTAKVAETSWGVARAGLRDKISSGEVGSMILSDEGNTKVADSILEASKGIVTEKASAMLGDSPDQYEIAKASLDRYFANPGAGEGKAELMRRAFGTDSALHGSIPGRTIISDGGLSLVPAGATSSSSSLSAIVPRFGKASREILQAGYQVNPRTAEVPGTNRKFRSVEEMVLWERENAGEDSFKPLMETLSDLKADGLLIGGPEPANKKLYGRNTALALKIGSPALAAKGDRASMVGDGGSSGSVFKAPGSKQ